MGKTPLAETLFWLTVALCILIVTASIGGILFEDELYALETPIYVAQIVGTDMADLFAIVPILLTSAFLMRNNSKKAYFVWSGTMMYMLYISISYCFAIHFNHLFLVYCGIFGLSFYLLIMPLVTLDAEQVKNWFSKDTKTTAVIIYLVAVAGLMSVLWLSDAIPASITGILPESATESGLITAPFDVLDLGLMFPGFFISAFLLYTKRALGYLLAPSFLTCLLVMGLALVAMVILMALRGFGLEVDSLAIFGTLAIISGLILVRFLRYCTGE